MHNTLISNGALVLAAAALATMISSSSSDAAEPQATIVFVGTYAEASAPGIFCFQMNDKTGELLPLSETSGIANPSFLALHPSGKYLYAVSEIADFSGNKSGAVAAFRIGNAQDAFALKLLNQQPSAGDGPCYVTVDPTGHCVLVANYGGGSVASLAIEEDGSLTAPVSSIQHAGASVTDRQTAPHAHSFNIDAQNKFAIAADLGLDQLITYALDSQSATLKPAQTLKLKPGSGPRHFAFHPDGRFAYTNGELDSTVIALSYDAERGELKTLQTLSTLPANFQGSNSTAEVQVHPSGRFVYVSNRGHNSLAIFAVDANTGKLTAVGHQPSGGEIPRNFGIHPSGKFLLAANQESGNVVVMDIDQRTGRLKATRWSVEVPKPVCIRFLVSGK